MDRTAVVTGGSSGIGRSVARALRDAGYRVFELSRSGSDADGVRHIACDVTQEAQVASALAQAAAEGGGLDLLVNNAGMGISGAVELTRPEDVRRIFEVNFFGVFLCCRAALPYLRQRRGRIVNISSVAAPVAIPYQAFYSATKAAVNSLTAALANEAGRFGVKACAVQPGDTATGFTDARGKAGDPEKLYGDAVERAVGAMEKDERAGMAPEAVAKVVLKAAGAKRPKLIYTVGAKYRAVVFLMKILPAGFANRLVGKLYG